MRNSCQNDTIYGFKATEHTSSLKQRSPPPCSLITLSFWVFEAIQVVKSNHFYFLLSRSLKNPQGSVLWAWEKSLAPPASLSPVVWSMWGSAKGLAWPMLHLAMLPLCINLLFGEWTLIKASQVESSWPPWPRGQVTPYSCRIFWEIPHSSLGPTWLWR